MLNQNIEIGQIVKAHPEKNTDKANNRIGNYLHVTFIMYSTNLNTMGMSIKQIFSYPYMTCSLGKLL